MPQDMGGVTTSGQSGRCALAAAASAARSVSSPARAADPPVFLRSDGSSGTPGRILGHCGYSGCALFLLARSSARALR